MTLAVRLQESCVWWAKGDVLGCQKPEAHSCDLSLRLIPVIMNSVMKLRQVVGLSGSLFLLLKASRIYDLWLSVMTFTLVYLLRLIYDPKACVHGCFQVKVITNHFFQVLWVHKNKIGLPCLCHTLSPISLMIFEECLCFTKNTTIALLLKEKFIGVCVRIATCRIMANI